MKARFFLPLQAREGASRINLLRGSGTQRVGLAQTHEIVYAEDARRIGQASRYFFLKKLNETHRKMISDTIEPSCTRSAMEIKYRTFLV